jgi:hypothetical protein
VSIEIINEPMPAPRATGKRVSVDVNVRFIEDRTGKKVGEYIHKDARFIENERRTRKSRKY